MELDAATVSTGLLSGAMEGLEAAASVAAAAVAAVAIPFVAVGAGLYWAKGGIDDLAELGRESAKLGIETEKLSRVAVRRRPIRRNDDNLPGTSQ